MWVREEIDYLLSFYYKQDTFIETIPKTTMIVICFLNMRYNEKLITELYKILKKLLIFVKI